MASNGLSSNWKALQQQLQAKKDGSQHRGVKRKASQSQSTDRPQTAKRRMGALLSKKSSSEKEHSRLPSTSPSKHSSATDLPLPAALTTPSAVRASDILNGGRTPDLEPGKYVALDCEMVGIGPHPETASALARASLVDYNGTQLYDSFVMPMEPVTDFRTAVSGITPALLKTARSFDDVQRDVAALLEGRILVGHAVRNDLRALMIGHPRSAIRDTSRHRPHRDLVNGANPALRHLASQLLGVEIQSGSHSSIEDARVTMALFRRDKARFESEAGEGATPKPKPGMANSATNGVRGTKRTGAKSKKRKVKK